MNEDEQVGVEQEAQGYSSDQSSIETQQEVSKETQDLEQSKRNDAERNWAEMRRKMREKDHQIEELKSQFEKFSKREATPQEEDVLSQMAEDDLLTVAQAKKLMQKMAANETQKFLKEKEVSEIEDRLRLRHRDYDDVVTKENIELLLEQERELAETLQYIQDPYKQAEAAYKMLKKFGKPMQTFQDKKKAEENSKKPLSAQAAVRSAAIGDAHKFENGFSKEDKARIYKEMQQAIKFG